jgi:microsomal epoxide hydrolase
MRAVLALVAVILAFTLSPPASAAQDRYFVTSDGVRLHYEEAGRGQTIVLVPGWTMPAWIWNAQIADFSRFYHVVAFDPRSQGDSDIALTGHEPVRRGEDIGELIAQLGPRPVLLVGWSLGVLDTLAYVRNSGDAHVAGLVLVDNSVGEDPPPSSGYAIPAGARKSLLRRPKPVPVPRDVVMRAFVRSMFLRPPPPDYVERLTEACLRTPPYAAAALRSYPEPRSYWRDAIYSTERPVLYIVRPHLAGQAANLAAHHAAAESEVWDDVGHAMFVDDPQRFDATVLSFIKRRVWP